VDRQAKPVKPFSLQRTALRRSQWSTARWGLASCLATSLLGCGGNSPTAVARKVPLSAEAELAATQGAEVSARLAPFHAAVLELGTPTYLPCPRLSGPAINISWGRLDHMIDGVAATDAHAVDSGDPLPFNDKTFRNPNLFRGVGLHRAEPRQLEDIARARAAIDTFAYLRVAKTTHYLQPQLTDDGEFRPGSLEGWILVFDTRATLVCAVSAAVESSESVEISAPDASDSPRVAKANTAALTVDLTRRLAGALREAAKPAQPPNPNPNPAPAPDQ